MGIEAALTFVLTPHEQRTAPNFFIACAEPRLPVFLGSLFPLRAVLGLAAVFCGNKMGMAKARLTKGSQMFDLSVLLCLWVFYCLSVLLKVLLKDFSICL